MNHKLNDKLITAAFIMEGLRDSKEGYDRVIQAWDLGCIELIAEITGYIPFLYDLLAAAEHATDGCYPGVFDYEVSSSFGQWFGQYICDHGEAPSAKDAKQWLFVETQKFFAQGLKQKEADLIMRTIEEVCMFYEIAI